jgi:hypothetical protein
MEDLKGKKVKGFKFSGNNIGYNRGMDKYIGVIGTVRSFSFDACSVKFPDGNLWSYPLDQIEKHLVEPEPDLSIEEILNNMKTLISKI